MKPKPLRYLFDAVHHGKYDFGHFLHSDVSSEYMVYCAKQRKIHDPNKTLKAYLTFLNTFVFDHLEVNHEVVYSYRKGGSPRKVAEAHRFGRAFLQADVMSFFQSIDRKLVENLIDSQLNRIPIPDLVCYLPRILDLITVDGTLPIGFPTSPPISNACLTPFDDDLSRHCHNDNLVYTRYADDLIISGDDRSALLNLQQIIQKLLKKHFGNKLMLNLDKCKITTVGRKIRILGLVILPNGEVTIDTETKRKIEIRVYFYIHDRNKFIEVSSDKKDKKDKKDKNFDVCVRELSGYINYVNAADQKYLQKLRRKFGATVIDSLIHQSAT